LESTLTLLPLPFGFSKVIRNIAEKTAALMAAGTASCFFA